MRSPCSRVPRHKAQDLSLAHGELSQRIYAALPPDELRDDRRIDHRLAVRNASESVGQDCNVEDAFLQEVADALGMLFVHHAGS